MADEVMCAMGRGGTLFAMAQQGVVPDLIVIAKGLGAGCQPIGALLARDAMVAPILRGSGALAVMEAVECNALLDRVGTMGAMLAAALHNRSYEYPRVGGIRGRGPFWSLTDRVRKTQVIEPVGKLAPALDATLSELGTPREGGLSPWPGVETQADRDAMGRGHHLRHIEAIHTLHIERRIGSRYVDGGDDAAGLVEYGGRDGASAGFHNATADHMARHRRIGDPVRECGDIGRGLFGQRRRSRVRTRPPLERGSRAPAAAACSRAAAGPDRRARPRPTHHPSPPGGPPAGPLV